MTSLYQNNHCTDNHITTSFQPFFDFSNLKLFVKIGAPLAQKCSVLPDYSQLIIYFKSFDLRNGQLNAEGKP